MESPDARFYDPEVGRFTTQDSYLGEINDPPSLHRYFYANARPTYFVDPTGHFGISLQDLKNSGKAFAGAVWGVGEVLASPGVFTYQMTGAVMYGLGATSHESTARDFFRTIDTVKEKGLTGTVVEGVSSQFTRINEAIDRGDAFQGGAGIGNLGGQALLAADAVKSLPRPTIAPANALVPAHEAVLQAGGTVALTGGQPATLAGAGALLMSNAAVQGAPPAEGAEGTGPSSGFGKYVEAEAKIGNLPGTIAELGDAVRMNAATAHLRAKAAGIPGTFGRLGTRAHSIFEQLTRQLDAELANAGSKFRLVAEEFRDSLSGAPAPRRAAGSKGIDVIGYENGTPVKGWDLKSGSAGWKQSVKTGLEKLFGVKIDEIKTGR